MSFGKEKLREDLEALMASLDVSSETISQDWQDGWATAMDDYIKSGTPTPASPSFSNQTGVKTAFQFDSSVDTLNALNLATACGTYMASLTVPVSALAK